MQEKDGNMSKVLEREEQKGSTCREAGKEITFWEKTNQTTIQLFLFTTYL